MAKPIYSAPDDFSISPLLQLLPSKSKASKLKALNSSLYARFEKVTVQAKEVEAGSLEQKSLASEILMLKQVLDWLDIIPDKQ